MHAYVAHNIAKQLIACKRQITMETQQCVLQVVAIVCFPVTAL